MPITPIRSSSSSAASTAAASPASTSSSTTHFKQVKSASACPLGKLPMASATVAIAIARKCEQPIPLLSKRCKVIDELYEIDTSSASASALITHFNREIPVDRNRAVTAGNAAPKSIAVIVAEASTDNTVAASAAQVQQSVDNESQCRQMLLRIWPAIKKVATAARIPHTDFEIDDLVNRNISKFIPWEILPTFRFTIIAKINGKITHFKHVEPINSDTPGKDSLITLSHWDFGNEPSRLGFAIRGGCPSDQELVNAVSVPDDDLSASASVQSFNRMGESASAVPVKGKTEGRNCIIS